MSTTPSTPRRALRRRTLFGAAAGLGAGALGVWGTSRLVVADPVDARAAKWRQVAEAGEDAKGIHKVMRDFMEKHRIRAAQLTVRDKDELPVSMAYTFAEADYPTTKPDSLFRVASVSKAFTCAAIHELSKAGAIDLSEPVFPYLGIDTEALPSQTKDPKVDTITIQQLVDHKGGWDLSVSGYDPLFRTRQIALDLDLPGRVAKRDIAEWMYGEPLQHKPGAKEVYCNFGYLLLGLVVEKATGDDFVKFLKTDVLTPLGVEKEVHLGRTIKADALPGEVGYDAKGTGLSAWDPHSDKPVPNAYGVFLIGEMDSGGGLVATARATSKLITRYAAWGLGGRAPGYARYGSMAGTRSVIWSRKDSVDWSYNLNTRIGDDVTEQLNKQLDAAVKEYLGG
ncbi:serine hydrolase domain-containing protein [Stackebrandtia nassauensis]|uniref:Beta-lactamase n=1 Tax=Stackebrandtia nassauensis (strain DSM 44728 / CIP 108903 / NRRL B-16338 / NBRC 102104 / LLR-40K-21) TaxID=446470 RepID=D3Q429_STANL|nr:serine hydrolase domain-containing protein [Stackebrandtia nassauensis]ADD45914.1 beta-lactamase [Stackebrandtia nassauensis DSM 44728]